MTAFPYIIFQHIELLRKIFRMYSTANIAENGRRDLVDHVDQDNSGQAILARSFGNQIRPFVFSNFDFISVGVLGIESRYICAAI